MRETSSGRAINCALAGGPRHDLEAAVGRDVVAGIVDDPGESARHNPPGSPPASIVMDE
jgi:hypothetical protein